MTFNDMVKTQRNKAQSISKDVEYDPTKYGVMLNGNVRSIIVKNYDSHDEARACYDACWDLINAGVIDRIYDDVILLPPSQE